MLAHQTERLQKARRWAVSPFRLLENLAGCTNGAGASYPRTPITLLVHSYQTTRSHTEDSNLHSHRCENLKSHKERHNQKRASHTTQAALQKSENCVLGAFAKLRRATISLNSPHGTIRLPLDGFSLNLISEHCFSINLSRKFKFHKNLTSLTGTLHKDLCTFVVEGGDKDPCILNLNIR